MRLASIIRFFIIGVLLISVIGMDGCSCNPPIIEWIKVFSDINGTGNFQEVLPDPTTSAYIINGNNAFQIRIKTREALTSSDLNNSSIQIGSSPPYTISAFTGEENTYYHEFQANSFPEGTYTATIIIFLNDNPSIQSITLQIKNTG